jgi:transposase
MSIVHQFDKRSGITYVYDSISTWNKEKKQSQSKRRLIGRLDKESGKVVATDGRMKRQKTAAIPDKPKPMVKRLFFGATYLLDAIGKELGVTSDLKQCFPQIFEQILSIAYYLIMEGKNPLYRFEKWGTIHKHPFGDDISSQRSSELFSEITEDAIRQFFKLQGKRRIEREHWAYDITSISSYSECLRQVQYGNNKDDDNLPQLNLALVFGEQSRLPFYYRKLAGNIPDVKTVKILLSDFDDLGLNKIKLVMDRGFYSEKNVNNLLKEHIKFLMATKISLKYVKNEIDNVYDEIMSFECYDDNYELYSTTRAINWEYKQERPYKGDVLKEKRRVYLHLYYNIDKATEDKKIFDRKLMELKNEIVSEKRIPQHEVLYKRYFIVKSTPVHGIKVTVNEAEVQNAKRYYGFFALLSNEKTDSITALKIYRNKDIVEKAFGNLKERLNLRRTLVSSEQSLNGKLFVEFIALIFLSHINNRMQEAKMYKNYTMTEMLDKLDIIECVQIPNKKTQIGEILNCQKEIYDAFGINTPLSL